MSLCCERLCVQSNKPSKCKAICVPSAKQFAYQALQTWFAKQVLGMPSKGWAAQQGQAYHQDKSSRNYQVKPLLCPGT